MRAVLIVFFLSVFAFAQTPAPKSTQKLPTKEDPQGYSSDLFDNSVQRSTNPDTPAYKAPKEQTQATQVPADLAQIVHQQFGPDFEVALQKTDLKVNYLKPQKEEAWTPFATADLDGDGVEDAIVVARCKKPLAGEAKFNYKVTDPFFTYNGYGDPKITSTMSSEEPGHNNFVLIIHGAGPEGWRAAQPKQKFVVINLPFENLSVTKLALKKKTIDAIGLDSIESSGALIYWDGKKYRWRDTAVQ